MSHQLTFNLGLALERKAAGMDDAANARRPALGLTTPQRLTMPIAAS